MDVLDDAGCLAMDLERLGAPRSAASFMRWYEEFFGVPEPVSLEHHKIAYRAFMRAKVSGVRGMQGMQTEAAEARRLADLSLRHLRAARARLVLVGGAPRIAAEALAHHAWADFRALRCVAPIDVLRHRLAARRRLPAAWSDADERIGVRLAREAEKWPSGEEIDTAGSADKAVEQATTVLGLEPLSDRPRRPNMAPD